MCTITAADIQKDGTIVAQAIQNIAAKLVATDPTVAANLSSAANALLAITSTWTTGSAVADFNDAANAVEAVLALVPQTSVFVPFVEIAVTALDILIANIGGSPAAGQPPVAITPEGVKAMQAKIATFPANPFRGKVTIQRKHFQSPSSSFKEAWNAEVDKAPAAGITKIA